MPALSNLVNGRRVRTSGANPATKEQSLSWDTGSWRTSAGTTVSETQALSLAPFFRGVQLIASTVGGLPIHVFEEFDDEEGNERARKLKTDDTAFLWRRPNPEMTMQTLWERIVGDEVRGNAFIFVEKDADGMPANLWHIERERVRVGRTSDRRKVYEVDGELPMIDYRTGGEIVHIPNWGKGLTGYDPAKVAPQALALGLSAEEYALRAYNEGSVPPGIITTTGELNEQQADAIASRWERLHAGLRRMMKIAVLGNGATFNKISNDLEQMQNIEARKLSRSDAAMLLGLPPFLLGYMDHASQGGGNGLEEQNRQLTTFNFNGHVNRVQQACSDDLLMRESTRRYMRMNTAGLLRGNTLQRYQAYRIADFMTINEKRALEELPPVEGGDVVLAMTNMVPLDRLGEDIAMGAGA